MSRTRVSHLIVGGGPAGLAEAFWRLENAPDAELLVAEAAPRCGGWIETRELEGYRLELGPQSFRPAAGLDAFLDASGLRADVRASADTARRRWFDDGTALHELPAGPRAFLRSRLLGPFSKLRVLLERAVRSRSPEGESVASFVARRFGAGTERLAEAMMHGIYGGDAHQLEVACALPNALALEREHGSVLRGFAHKRKAAAKPAAPAPTACSFVGGMQRSVDVLCARVGEERIWRGARATRVQESEGGYCVDFADGRSVACETLSLAVPARACAELVEAMDAELARELREIRSVSIACVWLGYDAAALDSVRFEGFGFLAPQGGRVLGAIDCSALFADCAPDGKRLLRVMSGGFAHPDECERDDEELVAQARATIERALGVQVAPSFCHVARARDAIAQPTRGHTRRLARIATRVSKHRGLSLRGASYRGVSLPAQWAQGGSRP